MTNYQKMVPEIKTKWVEALRSGKYEPGHRYLRQMNRFCPLGILMDLLHPDEWILQPPRFEIRGEGVYDNQNHVCWLPPSICDEIGLSGAAHFAIVQFTDQHFKNQNAIADWIEANL